MKSTMLIKSIIVSIARAFLLICVLVMMAILVSIWLRPDAIDADIAYDTFYGLFGLSGALVLFFVGRGRRWYEEEKAFYENALGYKSA